MLDRPRPWWVLASLVPFGWATWIGLAFAAVTARRPAHWIATAVFLAAAVATIIWTDGALILISWALGLGVSLALAPSWQQALRAPDRGKFDAARRRIETRREARGLVERDPELAREAGVGRPDLPEAAHGGLVDVNAAPAAVLARLPGIDDATAERIARTREELDGFASLEDLGATLDLPADTVEDLRDRAVFLPR